MIIKFDNIPTFQESEKYTKYLDSIRDSNAVFHCIYWVIRYSFIPEIAVPNTEIYYIDAGKQTLRQYETIYAFYDQYGLSNVRLCNTAGQIIKDPVYGRDITEEGRRFVEIVEHWLNTKGASKNPPDTKYLEKKLKEMRKK